MTLSDCLELATATPSKVSVGEQSVKVATRKTNLLNNMRPSICKNGHKGNAKWGIWKSQLKKMWMKRRPWIRERYGKAGERERERGSDILERTGKFCGFSESPSMKADSKRSMQASSMHFEHWIVKNFAELRRYPLTKVKSSCEHHDERKYVCASRKVFRSKRMD